MQLLGYHFNSPQSRFIIAVKEVVIRGMGDSESGCKLSDVLPVCAPDDFKFFSVKFHDTIIYKNKIYVKD